MQGRLDDLEMEALDYNICVTLHASISSEERAALTVLRLSLFEYRVNRFVNRLTQEQVEELRQEILTSSEFADLTMKAEVAYEELHGLKVHFAFMAERVANLEKRLNEEIAKREAQIRELQAKLSAGAKETAALIDALRQEIEELKQEFHRQLSEMRSNAGPLCVT